MRPVTKDGAAYRAVEGGDGATYYHYRKRLGFVIEDLRLRADTRVQCQAPNEDFVLDGEARTAAAHRRPTD